MYEQKSKIKITILGCGSSLGVPVIGCKCRVCVSNDPKNQRLRSALLIQSICEGREVNVLVDCGFDIKRQLLNAGIEKLDAVILTHNHADHLSGLDELRVFSLLYGRKFLPIYMHLDSRLKVMATYSYLFSNHHLQESIIEYYSKITISNITISFFKQDHTVINSLGLRINNFVYANDVAFFYEESRPYLQNMDIFVVDCCEYKSTNVHAGLERVLLWSEEFRPKATYLTNLSHKIEYQSVQKDIPSNMSPAYDGLSFYV
jgi:phosphoribosyl 1,2-cyclic phosphate phosphodiesterase